MPEWELVSLPDQEPSEETLPGGALRNLVSLGARGVESALGIPGDLAHGLTSILDYGLSKATGEDVRLPRPPTIFRLFGGTEEDSVTQFPGSEFIREEITIPAIESIAGEGYTEPRNKSEQLAQDVVSDFAALISPIPFKGVKLGKALALSGIGNLTGFLTKESGYGPGLQAGAKFGSMIVTSFLGNSPFLGKHIKDLYGEAERTAGEALSPARELRNNLKKLKHEVGRRKFKNSKDVIEQIKNIQTNITPAKTIKIKDLINAKQDINSIFPSTSGVGKSYLGKTLETVGSALDEAGKDLPSFARESLRDADDLVRATRNSNLLAKITEKINFKNPLLKFALGGVGFSAGLSSLKNPLIAASAVSLGAATNFAYLLSQSPAARKIYGSILKGIGKDTSRVIIKKARQLDDRLSKEFPEFQEWTLESLPK